MNRIRFSRPMRWFLPVVMVLAACATWFLRPDPRRKIGNRVVQEVVAFQRVHGHLPSSLSEIGEQESESGPVYYLRQNDGSFVVWYGLRLGESEVYDSKTGHWDERD
jgi:hypothetical protein